ncbi:uncharacterized protein [Leptinotarsa decemlineata]|uniref:uncharacterized protein n=1 Tax=Leptinotarsa decemlineata TaxID=7539 RepID=UPI003D303FBA
MCLWKVIIMMCSVFTRVKTETQCSMSDLKIKCRFMRYEDLSGKLTVNLEAEDILELNISDTPISHVDRRTFGRYRNIHTLILRNSDIHSIEYNAFADLSFLRNLNLGNNLLENFSSSVFSENNSLYWLDLSNNLLGDLTNFNVSYFPYLMIMNVSNNRLEYLPENIMDKLKEINNFYIITDNNPWNCSHPGWSQNLNPNLIAAFCTRNMFDNRIIQEKLNYLKNEDISYGEHKNFNSSRNEAIRKKCRSKSWCFSYCVFWFVAAVWMGVILGNVCKLKDIVCRTTLKMRDKYTQYDMTDLRPKT